MAQGLYPTPDHLGRAQSFYGQAAGSYGSMQKARPEPEKTAGGAISSGASGAMSGMMVGAMEGTAMGPGWGTAIGAGVGLGAYLLS